MSEPFSFLEQRLRDWPATTGGDALDAAHVSKLMVTAADALAGLRVALERWEAYGCPDCGGDCASANPPVSCCIMRETHDALAALKARPA